MYPEWLKYLRKEYKEENCVSGMLKSSINFGNGSMLLIGTPCIAVLNSESTAKRPTKKKAPKKKKKTPSPWSTSSRARTSTSVSSLMGATEEVTSRTTAEEPEDVPEDMPEDSPDEPVDAEPVDDRENSEDMRIKGYYSEEASNQLYFQNRLRSSPTSPRRGYTFPITERVFIDPVTGRATKKEIKPVKASEVYSIGDIKKANSFLRENQLSAVALVCLASHTPVTPGMMYIHNTDVRKFYFTGEKPIIHDHNNAHYEVTSLEDVYGKKGLKDFSDIIVRELKDNRYVSYTIRKLWEAKRIKELASDLRLIKASLVESYKYSLPLYFDKNVIPRVVIDTACISFYHLEDIIPIFDRKSVEGFCIDILFTNSRVKPSQITRLENSLRYRIVFSQKRENIFTIDGEKINNNNHVEESASHILSVAQKDIIKHGPGQIPNSIIKELKKKSAQDGSINIFT